MTNCPPPIPRTRKARWIIPIITACIAMLIAVAYFVPIMASELRLNAFLARDAIQASIPRKEPVPMICRFREAYLDNSFVAVCTNGSGSLLRHVRITAKNPSLSQEKVWTKDIVATGEWFELGYAQGWAFYPGESITFEADGFAPFIYTFTRR